MSGHKRLHAMTGIHTKITLKLRTDKCQQAIKQSTQRINTNDKFQNALGITDYTNETQVNNVDTSNWLMTTPTMYTNYLPKGTIFKHITFIPLSTPDFRKVMIFNCNNAESMDMTLRSTTIKRGSTITKSEIKKNIFKPITGEPAVLVNSATLKLPAKGLIVTKLAEFLVEKASTVGSPDPNFTTNDMKLFMDRKIKAYPQLTDSVKRELYDAIDEVFKNTERINDQTVVLNANKAEDTFKYLITDVIYKQ